MYRDEIKMRGPGQEARLQLYDLMPGVYKWPENHID
jgi:hypothetical protein